MCLGIQSFEALDTNFLGLSLVFVTFINNYCEKLDIPQKAREPSINP